MSKITTVKVTDKGSRIQAMKVIEEVYIKEKGWISTTEGQIPENPAEDGRASWFLARINGKAAGVLRLFYDPPLHLPKEYALTLNEGIDIDLMAKQGRFVDIGRFMILPQYRRNVRVALKLMRIALKEVLEKNYTHFFTDVYEGEPNSPLHFHTHALGFEIIGKHLYGDLNCSCTRILLTMDIIKAYEKLKERKCKVYHALTYGIRKLLDNRLAERKLVLSE